MGEPTRRGCEPTGRILQALSSMARHRWVPNLCEWIDNGYDWGAGRVSIEFGQMSNGVCEFVRVTDDGDGCEEMEKFFTLGDHGTRTGHDDRSAGMYGTGGTLAMCWACDTKGESHIVSVCKGVRREAECSWIEIARTGRWTFDDISTRPAHATEESGSTITVRRCERRIADRGDRWNDQISELGYLYAPALRSGRQLRLRRQPSDEWTLVAPWILPELKSSSIVACDLSIGKRKARLKVGVIKDDAAKNTKAGLTYSFMHRAMRELAPTYEGCGDYTPQSVCGTVDLIGKDWPVTLNKDDLMDGAVKDELFAAVYKAIHGLLMEEKNKAIDLELEAITEDITSMLNGIVLENKSKAKRGPRSKPGTHPAPTNPGRPHGGAEKEQAGDRFPPKRGQPSRYRIAWRDFERTDERISKFEKPMTVIMNSAHPWVIENRAKSREALLVVAAHTVGACDPKVSPEQAQMFFGDELLRTVGQLLKRRMTLAVGSSAKISAGAAE